MLRLLHVCTLQLITFHAAVGEELLENGDFEQDMTGWNDA